MPADLMGRVHLARVVPDAAAVARLGKWFYTIWWLFNSASEEGSSQAFCVQQGMNMVTRAWGVGRRYDTDSDDSKIGGMIQASAVPRAPEISSSLLKVSGDQSSGFFERPKPQYELVPASNFVNVKLAPYNAIGDGVHDDKDALNSALRAVVGTEKILWIPAGVYLISDTVFIPSGAKVVGQSWSQIMGRGIKFQNINSLRAVVKVGNVGDVGSVEIQDLIFTVKGKAAGAIVLQWNIHEASQGSDAMWGMSNTDSSSSLPPS